MSTSLPDPLDGERILAALSQGVRERVTNLEVVSSIDSTNAALGNRSNPPPGCSEVLLAEYQTAGRGRRGRSWVAPPGGAICFSCSWTFPHMPRHAGALSLAAGVCAIRALAAQGVDNVQLKWPNDLLIAGRKLGGILIELRTDARGAVRAVVGIGLNIALGAAALAAVSTSGLPATDLISQGIALPSRNSMVAGLLEALVPGLMQFEQAGFGPFAQEWRQADVLQGQEVTVRITDEEVRGVARGIDVDGALLVETVQGQRKFISADVTVRPVT